MENSWNDIIARYLDFQRAGGSPKTTVYTRRQHLEHMARRIGVEPVEVDTDALAGYMAGQSWAPETRRGRRNTFRSFWRWGVEVGGLQINAAEALPRVRVPAPRPRPCPDLSYRSALTQAQPRERLMLRLAAEMGLRRSEVARVHVDDLLDYLGGMTLQVHGKGGKVRLVPLPAGLALELRDACKSGYAFPGNDGGHLSPRWVGKLVTRLLPDGLTMHTLRHRFASRAWASGIDTFVIQDILGHASPATTRRLSLIHI